MICFQLERAWNSLKLREKVSLMASVVRGITLVSDIASNTLKACVNFPFDIILLLGFILFYATLTITSKQVYQL